MTLANEKSNFSRFDVSPAAPFQSLMKMGSDASVAAEATADFFSFDGSGLVELDQSANWRDQEDESPDMICPIFSKAAGCCCCFLF